LGDENNAIEKNKNIFKKPLTYHILYAIILSMGLPPERLN
jgi:hypothetical protein